MKRIRKDKKRKQETKMMPTKYVNELDKAVKCINGLVNTMGLSSIVPLNKDQLDQEFYKKEDIRGTMIEGACSLYNVPYTLVMYTDKNNYRIACVNIYFMIKNCCVPIIKTNIPEICNIARSDGHIHRARITTNKSMIFKEKHQLFFILLEFYKDEKIKSDPTKIQNCDKKNHVIKNFPHNGSSISRNIMSFDEMDTSSKTLDKLYTEPTIYQWGDMIKHVSISDFMKINNMESLEISFETINSSDYANINSLMISIIEYYNTMLKKWILNELSEKLLQQKINFTILLDNKILLKHTYLRK